MQLKEMDTAQLQALKTDLQKQYADYQKMGLKLNMSRGKPCQEQLDLTMPNPGC